MLWVLTMARHHLSINPRVRWWLRMTTLERFLLIIPVAFVHIFISGFLALDFMGFLPSLLKLFGILYNIFAWAFYVFFFVDLILNFLITSGDLRILKSRKDVILATRGEYIGGHPKLPHSRFLYLTIGGTQKNPTLSIILPSTTNADDLADKSTIFDIPLLEVIGKVSGIDDKFGKPGILNFPLTSATPLIWKGYRAFLNIEYTFAGRKYNVELSSFLKGNNEVQQWKNYLTCAQAEADTGEVPFGPWKSLAKKRSKAK